MTVIDIAKDALSVAETIGNFELVQKIADLQTGLMELQEQNRQLADDRIRL